MTGGGTEDQLVFVQLQVEQNAAEGEKRRGEGAAEEPQPARASPHR